MKNTSFFKKNISHFIVLSLILIYFSFIISLIFPARHVDPDFFQFLEHSEYYLQFKLPPFIQSLPANPILLGTFYRLFSGVISEIEIALWINAVSIVGAIYLMYVLLRKNTNQLIATLVSIFLITHPIIYNTAISNNSEALFTFFLMCLFLLIKNKKYYFAAILAAIGVFIRHESVFIFGSFLLTDFLEKRNFKLSLKYLLLFSILALPLLYIILTTNSQGTIADAPFLVEVVERIEDVPELRFFTHFPFSLLYIPGFLLSGQSIWYEIFGFLFWSTFFIKVVPRISKNKLALIALIFTFSYMVFHACFPAYLERYLVPIIFSFSLVLSLFVKNLTDSQKKVSLIIFILVILNNVWIIFPWWNKAKLMSLSSDYYAAQSILENTRNDGEYTILTPYPETLAYYYRDHSNIKLLSVLEIKKLTNCDDLYCATEKYSNESDSQIIMLYTSIYKWGMTGDYDSSLRRWYDDIGFYELGDFVFSEKSCLWYKNQWEGEYVTLEAYRICE
ncbi:MAG: hypothetical protein HN846_04800 [Candidatus Pacebacteria bacterium]|nr:hypothetical protein [Candidatus Paceibacterota bacterium]MBT6899274.1 hypothetical protein [Candidatus Paceibacterota bacterium]MBT7184174.1 hypothetical protein [Candidatus Paceibacterota bacterium]MBT7309994.1 hypothetical protein [Candidatus Paceibacterota bacterium]